MERIHGKSAKAGLLSAMDSIEDELGLPDGMAQGLGALNVAHLCSVWLGSDERIEQRSGILISYPARPVRMANIRPDDG